MNLINYIKIVRPKNLVIVALSQTLMFWIYLSPLSVLSEVKLDGGLWVLFIIDTLLIAAGGYVVNDLMDQKADLLNKPDNIFIGSDKISNTAGWLYYWIIVIAGFIIAFYIAYTIRELHLLFIYPLAVGLLYLYSRYFKRMSLLGNIVVSIFCAFVPAIIWYAEHDLINALRGFDEYRYQVIIRFFLAYISFAFLSTMVREIIKDIEDIEGDRKSGYQTFPIVGGIKRANMVASFFGLLLLCSYSFWFTGRTTTEKIAMGLIIVLGLMWPTAKILKDIYSAKNKEDYSSISKKMKYLMIISLFIFLCIPFIL